MAWRRAKSVWHLFAGVASGSQPRKRKWPEKRKARHAAHGAVAAAMKSGMASAAAAKAISYAASAMKIAGGRRAMPAWRHGENLAQHHRGRRNRRRSAAKLIGGIAASAGGISGIA